MSVKASNSTEVREGDTHQTSLDIVEMRHMANVPRPDCIPTKEPASGPFGSVVAFDLETTGFGNGEICQLAATYISSNEGSKGEMKNFNNYYLPEGKIDERASQVNKLTVSGNSLCYNGTPVDTTDLKTGLKGFISFLNSLDRPVLLVAHNGKAFDSRLLMEPLMALRCGLENELAACVVGFSDTMNVFTAMYPNLKSYKLENIAIELLKRHYTAHDAAADSEVLMELINHCNPSKALLAESSVSTVSLIGYLSCSKQQLSARKSLKPLIEHNVISYFMRNKMASTGLELHHLQKIWSIGKDDGIRKLFREKTRNGKARVTKDRKIIQNVVAFLQGGQENTNV